MAKLHEYLYLFNAIFLLVHQMDAAFWHEWDLFGLPGGLQLYLLLNIPIVLLVLLGQSKIARGESSGFIFSWILVGSGIFAAGIHGFFLIKGDPSFTLPVSLGLLLGTCALSMTQAVVLVLLKRRPA